MGFEVTDATLVKTKALPNGAAAVSSDGLDLGAMSAIGSRLADAELKISGPLLTTTELPDTKTMVYKVEHDSASDFSTVATLADRVLVQTGAGGTGAAAAAARFRFPTDTKRYVRVTATNDGAGDASGKSLTAELLF
jgi:hypothetical protein